MLTSWKTAGIGTVCKAIFSFNCLSSKLSRSFSCTGNTTKSDTIPKAKGSEIEERVRVRRVRTADVTRVLRFVRENCRGSWPGLQHSPSLNLVLTDYVSRTLAQGHSMLAEQHMPRRGWSQVRGVALATATCPWDSDLLDKWARCIRCQQASQLMSLSAHCMRAPVLHDKYKLAKILQTLLIVPSVTGKRKDVVQMLVENAIKRGRDVGFPLMRFDVTNPQIAEMFQKLNFTKEWEGNFVAVPRHRFKDPTTLQGDSCQPQRNIEPPIKVEMIRQNRETSFVFTGIIDQPKPGGPKDTETVITDSSPPQPPTEGPTKAANINFPNYIAVYSIFPV